MQYEKDASSALIQDAEAGVSRRQAKKDSILSFISRIFLQSFTMTFLAEWGDRSQLTTIILGAREVNCVYDCVTIWFTDIKYFRMCMVWLLVEFWVTLYVLVLQCWAEEWLLKEYQYEQVTNCENTCVNYVLIIMYYFLTVTIIGGVVFLLFAFSALFFDPNAE